MTRRSRSLGWDAVGLVVFAVMVFPVFWMISTSLKPNGEIYSVTPKWVPGHPTVGHFRDAIARPYFWTDLKNSLIVVLVTVGIAISVDAAISAPQSMLPPVPRK